MNNISKIILILSIAILGASALGVSVAQANGDNLVVEFETGICLDPDTGADINCPLFGEVNFLPGDDVVRWVKVQNNSGENEDIGTETINYIGPPVPSDDLSRALSIIIREQGGNDLYGGSSATGEKTLYNLFQEGPRLLTANLSGNGGQVIYDFEISFPIEKANEWQTKITQFDINVGFRGDEGGVEYCNYNGEQDNGETGVDCGGGGCPACGGGGGGGGGGGTPIPGLIIIKNPQVTFVPDDPDNDAIIKWTTSYKSTSQVIYSVVGIPPEPDEPHTFKFNEKYYGYAHAYPDPEDFTKEVNHTVVIQDLESERTYYYRVVSHASPPTISREYSFTVPGVKGASTQEQGGEQSTGGQGQSPDEGQTGDTGIGGKFVQGISSILGIGSEQGTQQGQEQEQDKETLSLDVLDELDLSEPDNADAEIFDGDEEKDSAFNLTASLSSAFSTFFDNLRTSFILVIAIIFFFLLLIFAGAKLLKDRKKKQQIN